MIVFDQEYSNYLREMYIGQFVNTNSNYYKKRIEAVTECEDGKYYKGFLWDCLKQPDGLQCKLGSVPFSVPARKVKRKLDGRKNVYIMMDLHSSERTWGALTDVQHEFRMKYRTKVICLEEWPDEIERAFPEDIYIFDDSLEWSFILTHEWYGDDSRLCFEVGEYKWME